MTRKKWRKMSLERRNVHIAKLCGWRNPKRGGGNNIWMDRSEQSNDGKVYLINAVVDNYCTDLNAIHHAENELLGDGNAIQNIWYTNRLIKLCGWQLEYPIHRATAAERAEALVYTMRDWYRYLKEEGIDAS